MCSGERRLKSLVLPGGPVSEGGGGEGGCVREGGARERARLG